MTAIVGSGRGKTPFDPLWIAQIEARIYKQCHPRQLGFVVDTGSRISCLVGRGGGKTTGGLLRFVLRMIRFARQNCIFLAATRQSAEELIWDQLKETISNLGIKATFNETKLRCRFLQNGSTLTLGGCDDKKDIGKLRGRHFDEVGVDECAEVPPKLLEDLLVRVVGPRLVGPLWMIGTPGITRKGSFFDATRTGGIDRDGAPLHRPWNERSLPEFANWDGWSSHAWTLLDGVEAGVAAMIVGWTNALKEKVRQRWADDHPVWRREYLGQWSADDSETVYRYHPHDADGKPHNQWDPERIGPLRVAKLPEQFTDWGFGYGMDLGSSDAFALEVFAFSYSDPDRVLYHVWELVKTRMYAESIAKALIGDALDHTSVGGIIGATAYPDAMVADMAGLGEMVLDELRNVYGLAIVGAPKGFRYKLPAVELFNGELLGGRVKILKGSQLETEMIALQWVTNEFGNLSEDKAQSNNASDAAIYIRTALATLFTTGIGPQPMPEVKRTRNDEPPTPIHRDPSGDYGEMLAPAEFVDDW